MAYTFPPFGKIALCGDIQRVNNGDDSDDDMKDKGVFEFFFLFQLEDLEQEMNDEFNDVELYKSIRNLGKNMAVQH